MKNIYSVKTIKKVMEKKCYQLFENDSKPFNLNLIGIRADDSMPNTFNDTFNILWKYAGNWSHFVIPCTTDAGTYHLRNPMSKLGCAIVKAGQYKGVWKLGKHRGKYDALVQKKSITVLRDNDKNDIIDTESVVEETGLFGINHHRAHSEWASKNVDKWSAGCIVSSNPDHYKIEIQLFKLAEKYWANSFSFTLLNEQDFEGISC